MVTEKNDEKETINQAKNGDKSAFMKLVSKYNPRVLSTASRFGRDPEEVRDLAQDIFVELWQGLPGYNHSAPFEHWLSRVATNRCLRYLRKNYIRRSLEVIGLFSHRDEKVDPIDDESVRARNASEARDILGLALRRLAPKDALAITLKEIEGRTIAEIARDTGWSQGSVKVRTHRARQKLRSILEDMGIDEATFKSY
jgi:RNA polymerase sigma-70 factor (ECF subfamily)